LKNRFTLTNHFSILEEVLRPFGPSLALDISQILFSRKEAPDPRMATGGYCPSENHQNQRPPALE